MVQDYNSAAVVDATGERIGTVERSYVDDAGTVRVVGIKMGTLRAKHRLVPVDGAVREKDELRIPYAKQTVEESPDVDVDDTLEGETLEQVRAYYAGGRERLQQDHPTVQEREATVRDVGQRETRAVPDARAEDVQELSRIRDRGDVIEVPVVEEELVKRPVVKEILRIRKHTVTDRQQVNEELRKEDVDVAREGDVSVDVDDQRRS